MRHGRRKGVGEGERRKGETERGRGRERELRTVTSKIKETGRREKGCKRKKDCRGRKWGTAGEGERREERKGGGKGREVRGVIGERKKGLCCFFHFCFMFVFLFSFSFDNILIIIPFLEESNNVFVVTCLSVCWCLSVTKISQ